MRLDHLAIGAETLEDGVAWAQEKLGVTFLGGGKHARFGTHNRLLGLADELYLEVIAVDPDAKSEGPRWFGLDTFSGPPRLVNWICEPVDFEPTLRHGMQSVAMQRNDLRWDMGAPADGSLPLGGAYPTVLRWHTDTPPGRSLPTSGVALRSLTIAHPQAEEIRDELPDLSDPRIQFETASNVTLQATFDTPKGRVTL
ncbi:VOC family protein [Octadecabacter sp. G9-8]|uniref:VOC family protein n=1 Tax=Octadecabacter dasysiphoniae TaxID=2909341 RepID=A0ABS9CYR5_9RHOB|nr:VOC family protein [Octadecabacter dasysiphoniae]MCF2871944.1 VOC family protein [Octadecabacter dasysiphoniae]